MPGGCGEGGRTVVYERVAEGAMEEHLPVSLIKDEGKSRESREQRAESN